VWYYYHNQESVLFIGTQFSRLYNLHRSGYASRSYEWSTDFLLREGSSREEIGKWLKKQVHAMATAEKISPGGHWYISMWTEDAKVWVQKNGGVHVVSAGA
jgi:hypothetical protein